MGKDGSWRRARAGLLVDLADLYRETFRPRDARRRLDQARRLIRRLDDQDLASRARDLLREIDKGVGPVRG